MSGLFKVSVGFDAVVQGRGTILRRGQRSTWHSAMRFGFGGGRRLLGVKDERCSGRCVRREGRAPVTDAGDYSLSGAGEALPTT